MADSPRSSFIPKQSISAVTPTVRRRRKFDVLGFIAGIMLVGSLILAVGTFFYKEYSNKELMEQKAALETERNRFSEGDIAAVKEFDRRLMAAQYLIDNHLSPSKLLDALELSTKETIQFATLSFEQKAEGDVVVQLSGLTETFASVALQALEFKDDPVMREAAFTGLNTSDTFDSGTQGTAVENSELPRVGFSVEGSIAPASIAFDGVTVPEQFETPADTAATGTGATALDS